MIFCTRKFTSMMVSTPRGHAHLKTFCSWMWSVMHMQSWRCFSLKRATLFNSNQKNLFFIIIIRISNTYLGRMLMTFYQKLYWLSDGCCPIKKWKSFSHCTKQIRYQKYIRGPLSKIDNLHILGKSFTNFKYNFPKKIFDLIRS